MKRRILLGIGVLGTALAALPAAVLAQSAPPDPPATYWGNATGATVGQSVVAIVSSGGTSTVCGVGQVLEDGGKTVYVVDVAAQSQIAGCGATGRQIRFYFAPTGNTAGRLASQAATWTGAGPRNQNLTAGAELQRRGYAPSTASDGLFY